MKFIWDENKRQSNLKKHGFDFRDAESIFAGVIVTVEDSRYDYREERFATLGSLHGRIVLIIHTETVDVIRIISIRKATKYEEQSYYEQVSH